LFKDSSQAVSKSSGFPQSAGYQRHITVESFWLEINRSFLLGTHVRRHQQLSHLQSIVEIFGLTTRPGPVTADIMQQLPLSLIPTFAVPAWIVMHVISLLKLQRDQTG
jgi:hypothetical protein